MSWCGWFLETKECKSVLCGFEGRLADMLYFCGWSCAAKMQLHFQKKIGHVSMIKGLEFLEAAKGENLVGLKQYPGH